MKERGGEIQLTAQLEASRELRFVDSYLLSSPQKKVKKIFEAQVGGRFIFT